MRISDWSSDVCSSDLPGGAERRWPRNACGRARLPAFAERAGLAAGRAGIQPGRADTGTTGRLGGAATATGRRAEDRKSVVEGKSVSVRVDLGGRRIMNKQT